MNYSEFWSLPHTTQKLEFYFIVRDIQKQLVYNSNKDAVVIHHLMNTDDQILFNTTHYERFGLNLDGTFEYGKYVIFVTKEEHNKIHRCNDESKKYLSDKMKEIWKDSRYRDHQMSIRRSESYRKRLSESIKINGKTKNLDQRLLNATMTIDELEYRLNCLVKITHFMGSIILKKLNKKLVSPILACILVKIIGITVSTGLMK